MNRYFTQKMKRAFSNRQPRRNDKPRFSIGYMIMIVMAVILTFRAFNVINKYSERGGLAYVQLLNYSMPVVEEQVYEEEAYAENKLTLKKVIAGALGLNNISTYSIVGSEISLFKNINIPGVATTSKISFFTPFKISEDSIDKLTDEDLAQLNAVSEAYDPSLKRVLDESKIRVLIYSTHSHEGYSEIGSAARWNSDNEDFNVLGVGDVLAKELEDGYGISVIHDKTIHDNDYNVCYDRSQETLQSYLNQYGDFDLIIDLHRDSAADKKLVTANINGQNLARMMFVTTVNSSRLEANAALANNLAGISNNLFPGLMRNKAIYHYEFGGINGFNMSFSDNTVVWEVGANVNTSVEAKLTAKYMARIIAEYLNRQE